MPFSRSSFTDLKSSEPAVAWTVQVDVADITRVILERNHQYGGSNKTAVAPEYSAHILADTLHAAPFAILSAMLALLSKSR